MGFRMLQKIVVVLMIMTMVLSACGPEKWAVLRYPMLKKEI